MDKDSVIKIVKEKVIGFQSSDTGSKTIALNETLTTRSWNGSMKTLSQQQTLNDLIPKEQKSESDLVIDEDDMDDEEKDFLKKYFQTQINSSGLRRSTTNLQMGGEKPFTA